MGFVYQIYLTNYPSNVKTILNLTPFVVTNPIDPCAQVEDPTNGPVVIPNDVLFYSPGYQTTYEFTAPANGKITECGNWHLSIEGEPINLLLKESVGGN